MEELKIGNKISILLLTSYKFPSGGGLSTYMEQTALGLKRNGIEVSFLSFNLMDQLFNKFLRIIFALRNLIFPFFFLLYLYLQKILFKISLFLNNLKEKWNLIHAQDPLAVIYGSFLKKWYGIPIIFTQHGFFVEETLLYLKKDRRENLGTILRKMEIQAILASSKVVAVEKSRFQYLKKYRTGQIYLMENFIDIDFFKNITNSRNFFLDNFPEYKNSFIFITPKRLNEHSNIKFLIKLAEKIKILGLKVIFFVFGYGSEKKKLISLIKEKNLSNIIKILKPFSHKQMPIIYNSTDAVIIPSKELKGVSEGSSYAVLEAMACEKPVFLSNIGPFKDLISHGNTGILFDLVDIDDLINWIQKLKGNSNLRAQIGKNGRIFIEKKHALASKINELLSIYGIHK